MLCLIDKRPKTTKIKCRPTESASWKNLACVQKSPISKEIGDVCTQVKKNLIRLTRVEELTRESAADFIILRQSTTTKKYANKCTFRGADQLIGQLFYQRIILSDLQSHD